MPSKLHYELNKIRGKTEDNQLYTESIAIISDKFDALLLRTEIIEQLIPELQEIKNITIQEKKDQPYGLIDLIAGVTPTLVGWTTDPTDGADITDGDISTFCTTGDAALTAWAQASFEWDLGAFHDVQISCVGGGTTTVGTFYIFIYGWNGTSWIKFGSQLTGTTLKNTFTSGMQCSKVKIGLTVDTDATVTPNIREFHVWKLK